MNPYEIIDKYYPENTQQRQILVIHSLAVSGKAMKMLDAHPELRLNRSFVKEAALLHDIGIFQTDAPTIQCFGTHPYIAHGYLGAEILRAEGFPQHALVCERHTGAGLSLEDIIAQQLPVPHREMLPITLEEQLICFADKFFSKTHLSKRLRPSSPYFAILCRAFSTVFSSSRWVLEKNLSAKQINCSSRVMGSISR